MAEAKGGPQKEAASRFIRRGLFGRLREHAELMVCIVSWAKDTAAGLVSFIELAANRTPGSRSLR